MSIIVNLSQKLFKLREIKMDDTTKKEKITEFIDALENTKEDKSNEVAESPRKSRVRGSAM